MRYVYVVEGSEDGIIGVFTNITKASKKLENYGSQIGRCEPLSANELRELRRTWVLVNDNGAIYKYPIDEEN